MPPLEETVTVRREVPHHIADLVYFVKSLIDQGVVQLNPNFRPAQKKVTDEDLIAWARNFYDNQHGDD